MESNQTIPGDFQLAAKRRLGAKRALGRLEDLGIANDLEIRGYLANRGLSLSEVTTDIARARTFFTAISAEATTGLRDIHNDMAAQRNVVVLITHLIVGNHFQFWLHHADQNNQRQLKDDAYLKQMDLLFIMLEKFGLLVLTMQPMKPFGVYYTIRAPILDNLPFSIFMELVWLVDRQNKGSEECQVEEKKFAKMEFGTQLFLIE
ncbi:hypothetical protein GCK72_015751 [Caenorhabditis remanei]|uniref:Uncharacterized protein n=1 Tax=Caenorhabditis remanei TaxID=31234 RepID=A0A6A5GVV5_CAERE|nr:hypothetical protein GCK72_015751 [Caenorhabditis remanei]KAF1759287.1 hypothetical protein GCK72_015751 [Caenorhabditis remanei]